MTSYTNNTNNMRYKKNYTQQKNLICIYLNSVTLDFLILYTRECMSCNKHRQLIIFQQLCSNNQLSNPIRFVIQYTNLSYVLSDPVVVYTSYIPIQNIIVVTRKI